MKKKGKAWKEAALSWHLSGAAEENYENTTVRIPDIQDNI
jgi:hypothetical protein